MTDGEDTPAPAAPAAPPEPAAKPKRARKRPPGNGAPRKRAAKAALEPAPQAQAPPPPARPPAAPAQALNEVIMGQTAESLAQLSANLASAMTRANQVFSTAFLEQSKDPSTWKPDPLGVQTALNEVWSHLALQPETLRDAHAQLWARYGEIWQRHAMLVMTGQPATSEDATRDKRFRDPEWRSNPMFSMLRETYLATAGFITELVEKAEGVDEGDKRKAAFFIKQAVDAASPSNFLMTNPTALRALLASHGESLKRGIDQLSDDLKRGRGNLAITQADLDAFKVGENVATTPGKVVFRNRLFELLQYNPTTETVHEVPLLIFPPWINKFYILDLQPENSMIRWLSGQGFTVFVCSWVNPDVDKANYGFDDYLQKGIYRAVEKALEQSRAGHINTVGYCIGGTLMGAALAHMAEHGDDRVTANTFFAAQHDFAEAGDLLLFTDDHWLNEIEQQMDAAGGVLPGAAMADTFNALRANDLIWSFFVSNYLMGKDPPAFDLLFWNADQTRMPKKLHLDYLRSMYGRNALSRGEFEIGGVRADLSKVKIPLYFQASREDHIAPMNSVYRSARAFPNADVTLTLAGSGHIAGVVNPPSAKKYQHWTNPALPPTLAEWQAGAEEHPGSWWNHWADWLHARSGGWVPARDPQKGPLPAIEPAPGSYVKVKS